MDNRYVRDLTVAELRDIMREVTLELLAEVSGGDPDAGLELRPEVIEELLVAQREKRRLVSHEQVLDEWH